MSKAESEFSTYLSKHLLLISTRQLLAIREQFHEVFICYFSMLEKYLDSKEASSNTAGKEDLQLKELLSASLGIDPEALLQMEPSALKAKAEQGPIALRQEVAALTETLEHMNVRSNVR